MGCHYLISNWVEPEQRHTSKKLALSTMHKHVQQKLDNLHVL